jgi:DNA-directed RNA polymerase
MRRRERSEKSVRQLTRRALLQRHAAPLIEFITEARKKRPQDRMPSLTDELWQAMRGVRNDVLVWVILYGMFDIIWDRPKPGKKKKKRKHRKSAVAALSIIGREIERECRGAVVRTNREAFTEITKVARKGNKPQWRRGREESKVLARHGLEFQRWDPRQLTQAGAWAFECCYTALSKVFPKPKAGSIPAISASGRAEMAALERTLMLTHPVFSPLDKPPAPWVDFEDENGIPFVRNAREPMAIRLAMVNGKMRSHTTAVDYLGSTALTVNEPVFDFVQEQADRRDPDFVLKKVNTEKDWKVLREYDLVDAEEWVGRFFYNKRSIDTRGRIYPLSYFDYLRADHIRGLIEFAEGVLIDREGVSRLEIAAAATYNAEIKVGDEEVELAHVTDAQRLLWTADNFSKIQETACDPQKHIKWLRKAKHPIRFLTIAKELTNARAALDAGRDYITTTPIEFDACNSGVQFYSLLVRDPIGAMMTNLIPGDPGIVEDYYLKVCERVKEQAKDNNNSARWWNESGELTRPLFKALLVPDLYGSTEYKKMITIYAALRDHSGLDKKIKTEHVKWLIGALNEQGLACQRVVEQYLQKISDVVGREGKTLAWTSSTGLRVFNFYQKIKNTAPKFYLGNKEPQWIVGHFGELMPEKATSAIAANFIHTLDAAFLVAVVIRCKRENIPLICVHDCFAVLAPHARLLQKILREELVRLFEQNDPLAQIRESAARILGTDKGLPQVPTMGTLDLKRILKGRYAFQPS